MRARGAAPEVSRTSGHGHIDSGDSASLPRRPPELRRCNADPLEQRISRVQLSMLLACDWETRAAHWREILRLLKRRPPEVVEQFEAKRMARVLESAALPERGVWVGDRFYPRWRIEELAEKYREPRDELEDDETLQ